MVRIFEDRYAGAISQKEGLVINKDAYKTLKWGSGFEMWA
jgi:hypothetical protein